MPPSPLAFSPLAFPRPILHPDVYRAEKAIGDLADFGVVTLAPDGRVYTSRRDLEGAFHAKFWTPRERLAAGFDLGGLLRSVLPTVFDGQGASCHSEKSGPYRRVYSKPGFSFLGADVFLPSAEDGGVFENKDAGHGDTSFVYVGGWGTRGGAVDAGFQHGRSAKSSSDDWAPFFLVQQPGGPSASIVSPERQDGGAPWRLAGGTNAKLKFWVTRDAQGTMLHLFVGGTTSQDGKEDALTLSAPIDDSYAWDPRGGRNVLKRMTTIGQTFGQENLASGSHLHGVHWRGCTIGRTEADARPWTSEQTGGYCSFPDPKTPEGARADDPSQPKWRVQWVSAAEETDSVTLK
ncbi:hypothetical protein [Deinococcus yavapaiensis]|uniref:Uncharacterized protein n=1 Tax=Deinococcus yavapaiensis KR-236 TaxID=694435 RepID=A0A318SAS9_9DEIO|nr:hypothetical protein [Deinococcus yavapaiensis]PYE55672.1 hypothetical protein DES52_10235 [Deinococcus yavapaiensis KR-236]